MGYCRPVLAVTATGPLRVENSNAYGHGNQGKNPSAISSAQGGRAIRHRAGPARAEDGAMARHICDYFRLCAQSRINAGRRHGGGLGIVVLGRGRSDHQRGAARDDRLYDHRDRRRRLRVAGSSLDAHGLWLARREVGAVVPAHDRVDLLVRLSDRRRLARRRGDTRPVDRNRALTRRGQRHLRGSAGDRRDNRLHFAEAPVAHRASLQNFDPVVRAGATRDAQRSRISRRPRCSTTPASPKPAGSSSSPG